MSYPVHTVTLPSDLVGTSNGNLTTQLVSIEFAGRPVLKVHHGFARSWRAFYAACLDATGVVLTAVSAGDAYRSFTSQETLFYQRYTTTYIAGTSTKTYLGKTWYLKIGMAMAAVPGTSNHGWGLALDTAEWTGTTVKGISGSVAWTWILANAGSFGFSWEAQSEPWHLRLYTGDVPTQRVIDYENPPVPLPPPTPVYDEDMPTLYRDSRFWNVFLVNGDVTTIGPELNSSLIARGVAQVVGTHDQSLISFMRKSQIKTGQLVASSTPGNVDFPTDLIGV